MRNITLGTYTSTSLRRRMFLINAGLVYGIILVLLLRYGFYDFQIGAI